MKRRQTKLSIARDTLRWLNAEKLGEVAGGTSAGCYTKPPYCTTSLRCPSEDPAYGCPAPQPPAPTDYYQLCSGKTYCL